MKHGADCTWLLLLNYSKYGVVPNCNKATEGLLRLLKKKSMLISLFLPNTIFVLEHMNILYMNNWYLSPPFPIIALTETRIKEQNLLVPLPFSSISIF